MAKAKIIFLDVDGTLIDYNGQLPASARTAVDKARANGHLVYLCTGCSKAELSRRQLPETDGLIGGNGAYVEDHGQVIMHQRLSRRQVKDIVDWCRQRQLGFYLEANSGLYCNDLMLTKGKEAMIRYGTAKGAGTAAAQQNAAAFISGFMPAPTADLYRDDINKIDFVLSGYQDHLDSKEAFPKLQAHTWGGQGEEALFGDLGPAGITKKHAIGVLLKHLNCGKEDTIAFGDAKIDISMFELCGYSVAMGSGGPECRAAADYVTAAVDDDGLCKAFEYLHLI